ncbi:secreted RxLR effector protein 161-like [Hevea brasiliensis]|uniref:secreted RxLR effector protein 161-like n=1 Tax=Hevea brasiliensis TaxID=3981 RepID=UPI0025D6F748|nr:secreted RxLR effector protein 161-like [Hevea brasiliensis]
MTCPRKEHWQAEKWIMRYLKDTVDVGLIFDKAKMSDLFVGYVDLDFTGDLDKRRSLTSYLFSLSGSAISLKATLQAIVALSTIEAEYMALAEAVKTALWLQGLVGNLGLTQNKPIIFCDS